MKDRAILIWPIINPLPISFWIVLVRSGDKREKASVFCHKKKSTSWAFSRVCSLSFDQTVFMGDIASKSLHYHFVMGIVTVLGLSILLSSRSRFHGLEFQSGSVTGFHSTSNGLPSF